MAMIPKLRQSLCGCTLETGSMIIAWLAVISTSLQIVLGACFYGIIFEYLEKELKEKDPVNFDGNMVQIKLVTAIIFVIFGFVLIVDTLLLVGIYKKNHCLMTPYLIFAGIGCVISVLGGIINIIATLFNIHLFFSTLFQCGLTAGVVYCFLIVYSFYCEIKEEKIINDNRFKQLG